MRRQQSSDSDRTSREHLQRLADKRLTQTTRIRVLISDLAARFPSAGVHNLRGVIGPASGSESVKQFGIR